MRCAWLLFIVVAAWGCGKKSQTKGSVLEADGDPQQIQIIKYEKKARQLLDATRKLADLRTQVDDQQRRLQVICVDYPDHQVCLPQTEAAYAREAFCGDVDFTSHVDGVVNACHEGECKQIDQAEQITREQYMLLTQRLPHSLVTFRAGKTGLDRRDKGQLQQFLEYLQGERGYVIIVGRASKDGSWRKNIRLALQRAENTRRYLVNQLGVDAGRVGFITYGADKMYLTQLDADRLSEKRLSVKWLD